MIAGKFNLKFTPSRSAYILWFPAISSRLLGNSGDSGSFSLCDLQRPNVTKPANYNWDECDGIVPDKVYMDSAVLGFIYMVVLTLVLIGQMKMRLVHVILTAQIVSCVCAFLLPHVTNGVILVVCFTCFVTSNNCCITLFNICIVQVFPASLCGMAVGVAIFLGTIGIFVGANVLGFLLSTHCEATIYGTGVLVICGILCLISLPKKINYKAEQ